MAPADRRCPWQCRWNWIRDVLFIRALENNGEDLIDLKGSEHREITVRLRWCEARWWHISGGRTDTGNVVVKITVQIMCVDCR